MEKMILNMLLKNLQNQNPQMYQQITQIMNNGGNPKSIIRQMLNASTPDNISHLFNQAKMIGVPDNILSQIQNFR